MAPRKEVQAGDDALDSTALSSGTVPSPQDGHPQPAPDDGFESDEERAAFEEMRANSGPNAQVVDDNGDQNAGITSRDVRADADAAAAAAALKGPDGQTPPQGAPKGQQTPAAEDDDDEDDVDPTKGGEFPQRVNYNKFRRAREKANKLETELKAEREKNARIDERFKVLSEALQAPDPKAAKPGAQGDDDLGEMPDPEEDIFKAFTWSQKFIGKLAQKIEQLEGGFIASNEDQQIRSSYANDIDTFRQQHPDFPKAYEHLMAVRVADLAMYHYGIDLFQEGAQLTPQQLQEISRVVEDEERNLAATAIKQRRSPAQQVYVMARARGYNPAAAQPNGSGAPAPNGGAPAAKPNGAAAPNGGAPGKPRSAVSDAVAAAKRGVATNASLSSGGGAPEGELTREQLMSMDDDKFNQFMNTASKEEMKRVLGH